ncbi:MAG: type II toxin-antitoxin system RelE/ParE family toxin [Candidatus Riflebacteria bacterium]|nr:type II toxin-antitoxin system RelE/ParE family toxin [Candidatus Riflebacteria bacterium]
MFDLRLTGPARKDLDSIDEIRKAVVDEIIELKKDPKIGHSLKQNLQGAWSLDFTIKGSGQYRAAYIIIEADKVCLVFAIGPHENFYDLVSRRASQLKGLLKEVKEANKKPSGKKSSS